MADGNSTKADGTGAAGETREERLARQLRENLKRRKAQARALKGDGRAGNDDAG